VNDLLKRLFDVVVAGALLVVLTPLLGTVAILVAITMGRPVIFRQRRPGLHGDIFTILKFRTMTDGTDVNGDPLPDSLRITRLGRVLRRASLDELPELVNVVRGDMSLVGPRPLLPEYLSRYSTDQMRRHEVRPGITGWSQVNGRNTLTWDDRLALDVWYVDNRSLRLDLRILAMTLGFVIRGEGIAHPGVATMEPFRGTERDTAAPGATRHRP
jgi:lipopolysaccharide/colanic/teichoic acid biosynthesis glycosyltransferase